MHAPNFFGGRSSAGFSRGTTSADHRCLMAFQKVSIREGSAGYDVAGPNPNARFQTRYINEVKMRAHEVKIQNALAELTYNAVKAVRINYLWR